MLQTDDWRQSINNILETTAKIMNTDGVQYFEIEENKKLIKHTITKNLSGRNLVLKPQQEKQEIETK